MRELRRAAKEGPRAFLASASRLPHRHPWMLGSAVGALALALLAFGLADTRSDVRVLQPQVTEIIREAGACRADATPRELRSCVQRIEIALSRCQHSATCRAEFRSLIRASRRGGDAQTSPSARQLPAPGVRPGGREGQRPIGGRRTDRPSRPDAPSVPDQFPASPAPAPTAPGPAPSPTPQPGNSGSTPGTGQGTKACVDLIVSACVDAPRLRP